MRDMRESGVEWIGSVPATWQTLTIGSLFKIRNEKVNDTDYPPLSVSKGGIVPQMENVAKSDANDNRKMVLADDFVINSRSDRKQSCGVSPLDGSVSLINIVLYTAKGAPVVPAYLNYLMKNHGFAEEFYRWGHGIVADLWTTRWQEMKSILLPIPTVEEQQQILAAISVESEKVDALIANVQAQIEKLKAYKQSLITEVVTKGLDPSVPMKDSGVDWIGEIPMHWNIVATKYLFEIFSGATPKSEIIANWDGNIIWITPADYKTDDVFVSCGRRNLSEQGFASCSTSIIPANSIIFSKRAPIGAVAINTIELCTNQGCLSCVNKDESNINARFFYYVMAIATEHYELLGSGTTFKEISASNFANFVLPWPAIDEQIAMVEYLDDKCTMIAQLIAIKQKKINKLTEYKKSIIYEYVTGKKEVP